MAIFLVLHPFVETTGIPYISISHRFCRIYFHIQLKAHLSRKQLIRCLRYPKTAVSAALFDNDSILPKFHEY